MRQSLQFDQIARTALIFGLVGPPIGGIAFTFIAMGTIGIGTIPVAIVLSYIAGFVPALLTGLVAGIARQRLDRIGAVLVVVASGALFSVLFTVLTGDHQDGSLSIEPETLKLTALPGAISALILVLLIRRKV